ncbi:DUF294 nucleotidyltransferase-like domain-containing protein [Sediminibacillus halophilus]|uniref:CBS domain-containing protein n=1 Tax=Sediminibacillus halophilus TaxID=482461 RepID=A0A1G9P0E7_9BACI|nr:DUF294 nucleotidyltransferase-like domain-containing protein [Sediminibacillus halophilus]SDL91695.1 CBS domain-containing protein [Sediminibacillus halophilus]
MTIYREMKANRSRLMAAAVNHQKLNAYHDQLMAQTVQLAMEKVKGELGDPPAPFAFFLMGSAGRYEQSVWSDQDHGIIFAGDDLCKSYFLRAGTEISNALELVGYERCDGEVMSSNPLWCNSLVEWHQQITAWMTEASWQTLRHFSTFFDSRVLIGDTNYLTELKHTAFSILEQQPDLFHRLIDNVDFYRKGIGIFGQLLPEQQGEQSGTIHLKQKALFPYVNALRLLALKNKIFAPSTLSRFSQLPEGYQSLQTYEKDFRALLDFRLKFRREAKTYKEVHLISIQDLSKQEKQELKSMMRKGYKLFSKTKTKIEEACSK